MKHGGDRFDDGVGGGEMSMENEIVLEEEEEREN